MTTAISNYENVKAAFEKFNKAQTKYSAFGANDTEPRNVFANIIEKLINDDEEVAVPMTPDGWELYASTMNCNKAAAALHAAATAVVQLINSCPTSEMRKVRKYVENYWGW